ncbi:Hypothetical protein PHPALM_19913 [Phytophthora palmivora]|uniref:Uncharacterized protein n=1 Tax=Phytophthora palmivora TaxID=4796 RepID=A0A2P4XG62_9STRA|nr:Hypothetical protein PHPALM_19913 [Phytophthora palmivora]
MSASSMTRSAIHTWADEKEEDKGYHAKAVLISLEMITVLHRSVSCWFKAVSSFTFYRMCRINEVLALQWKNISL